VVLLSFHIGDDGQWEFERWMHGVEGVEVEERSPLRRMRSVAVELGEVLFALVGVMMEEYVLWLLGAEDGPRSLVGSGSRTRTVKD
jgi:hypothetical protein